jgi:hypothetical protein
MTNDHGHSLGYEAKGEGQKENQKLELDAALTLTFAYSPFACFSTILTQGAEFMLTLR